MSYILGQREFTIENRTSLLSGFNSTHFVKLLNDVLYICDYFNNIVVKYNITLNTSTVLNVGSNVAGVVFDENEEYYYLSFDNGNIEKRLISNDSLISTINLSGSNDVRGISIYKNKYLYVASSVTSNIHIIDINTFSEIAVQTTLGVYDCLVVDDKFWYVAFNNTKVTISNIDDSSGAFTEIKSVDVGVSSLGINFIDETGEVFLSEFDGGSSTSVTVLDSITLTKINRYNLGLGGRTLNINYYKNKYYTVGADNNTLVSYDRKIF